MENPNSLISGLRAVVDDDLRTVITYDRTGFDIEYCRTDLSQSAIREHFSRFHDGAILRQIGVADSPGLSFEGESDPPRSVVIRCLGYLTDWALVFQLPNGRYDGTIIAIEPDTNASIDAVRRELTNLQPLA